MAKITVNHKDIRKVANKVTRFEQEYVNNNNKIGKHIQNLKTDWSGKDYDAIHLVWRDIHTDKKSVVTQFDKDLLAYADLLNTIAEKYEKAQADAYDRARKL